MGLVPRSMWDDDRVGIPGIDEGLARLTAAVDAIKVARRGRHVAPFLSKVPTGRMPPRRSWGSASARFPVASQELSMTRTLIAASATFVAGTALGVLVANAPPASASPEESTMRVQYLEIVTRDVDAVIAAYASALHARFGEPDSGLGGARTASLAGGGLVGVRAPLREDEDPVVRPYWLVPDIGAAHAAAVRAGGLTAHPPLRIPGHGTFAIYYQGGNDHGLWQF
jgi:predicted enzyme related to lactoylglutathione lyase